MQLALPTSSVCGKVELLLSDVSLSLDLNQKRSVLFENMVVENSRMFEKLVTTGAARQFKNTLMLFT